MSARRKRARKRQPATPKKSTPTAHSPAAASRQDPSISVSPERALDECVGAICLVEVTLHSLESQEIASPEQEVLKRALKALWVVHDWIDDLTFKDSEREGTDREIEV